MRLTSQFRKKIEWIFFSHVNEYICVALSSLFRVSAGEDRARKMQARSKIFLLDGPLLLLYIHILHFAVSKCHSGTTFWFFVETGRTGSKHGSGLELALELPWWKRGNTSRAGARLSSLHTPSCRNMAHVLLDAFVKLKCNCSTMENNTEHDCHSTDIVTESFCS